MDGELTELYWAVDRRGRRYACRFRVVAEECGVDVQLERDGAFLMGRRFDRRSQAVEYAEKVRHAVEADEVG